MVARIHRPRRGATQSGRARMRAWLLEFERTEARVIEPLMGWTATGETDTQVRIPFDTKEEAVAFAEKIGVEHRVEEPSPDRERRGLSYSDNFKPGRIDQWTH